MSGYKLHPEAFMDIDDSASYIGQDSIEAAHRVVDEFYRAIHRVTPHPFIGHRRTATVARASWRQF